MATPPKTWAKIQPPEVPVNLLDITTEQLAESMQEREMRELDKCLHGHGRDTIPEGEQKQRTETCEMSDEIIAHKLQNEYNHEYNRTLERVEEVFNRGSKVGISYINYRLSSHNIEDESNVDSDDRDFDRFVNLEKEVASIPRCGYKKTEGSEIITKHDTLMSSRMNACRVLEFPPGINTGDTGGFDMRIDNKVYNTLRTHQYAQKKKRKTPTKPKTHPK